MKLENMPLRVLFVTPDLFGPPGGIARFSRLCCQALTEASFIESVDIVALNDIELQNEHCALESKKVRYYAMSANKRRFLQQLWQLWFARRHYHLLFTTHVNLTAALWPLQLIQLRNSALVAVAHGIDVWDRLSWLRRTALRNASQILAVSQVTQSRMEQANGIRKKRVRILYNCLDPNLASPTVVKQSSTTALSSLKSPSILTVSRLSIHDRYKGHAQILQALAQIEQQVPPIQYYVVGEGELKAKLQELSRTLGISTTVHFLGQVDEATLQRLYQHADLFVMPSRGEGFGLVYLEAMACGTPVIAGNQDAAVEVVEHGETGLLVDPDNVTELAQSILQLLTNNDLRKKMGEAGCQVAMTKFSYERFRETLFTYLQELL